MPIQEGRAKVPFYPDDLLPKMQQILAILADLGFQHEIQRDHLESWSEDQQGERPSSGRRGPVPQG